MATTCILYTNMPYTNGYKCDVWGFQRGVDRKTPRYMKTLRSGIKYDVHVWECASVCVCLFCWPVEGGDWSG